MKRIWILVLEMTLLLSACGTGTENGNGMETHSGWTHPAAQGQTAAVYFAFHNHSSKADELIGASTEVAETVEIQDSTGKRVESVPLKAFTDIDFAPDGLHLVLVHLQRELKLGDQFQITLHFRNSKDIKDRVSVRDTPPPAES